MKTSLPASGQPLFRFAPSPNGLLHLGHALSALTNQRSAAEIGGRLLLRIEDIDPTRCTPEFEQAIHDDLAWLGLRFDGAVRRQSEHLADYASALGNLQKRGLVYPCFCSRQQVKQALSAREAVTGTRQAVDPDGAPLYPGTCKELDAAQTSQRVARGLPHVWRLDMTRAVAELGCPVTYPVCDAAGDDTLVTAQPERWGDVVVARKETPTSYHLSVVVDDALQGVSHVVRGRDLEAATDIHVVLQQLLGLPTPRYQFHALLLDETGQKLAKSRMSESLADMRARGVTATDVRAKLGFA